MWESKGGMNMKTLWIARDKDGKLWLYIKEPIKLKEQELFIAHRYCIDNDLFPSVTFENSPHQVELKLKKENG